MEGLSMETKYRYRWKLLCYSTMEEYKRHMLNNIVYNSNI
jgi:hypothetical protein